MERHDFQKIKRENPMGTKKIKQSSKKKADIDYNKLTEITNSTKQAQY